MLCTSESTERSLHSFCIKDSYSAHSYGSLPVCRPLLSNCWHHDQGIWCEFRHCSSLKCISSSGKRMPCTLERSKRSLHRFRFTDLFAANSFGGLPVCRLLLSNCWHHDQGITWEFRHCSSLKCISSQERECLAHLREVREVFFAFAWQVHSLHIALAACLSGVLCSLIADIMIRTPDESSDIAAHWSALQVRKGECHTDLPDDTDENSEIAAYAATWGTLLARCTRCLLCF